MPSFLFFLFAAILLFSAWRVITAKHTVHAALFLLLAFAQAACLWLMLGAEFLALTLVLVYMGAVMVLFLFVVMMLDLKLEAHTEGFWRRFGPASLFGLLIAAEMILVLGQVKSAASGPEMMTVADGAGRASNTAALGELLFGPYVVPVQLAATILLVAMVAAITLTLRRRKDSKAIAPGHAVRVKAKDRMEVVSMPVSQVAPATKVSLAKAESSPAVEPQPATSEKEKA